MEERRRTRAQRGRRGRPDAGAARQRRVAAATAGMLLVPAALAYGTLEVVEPWGDALVHHVLGTTGPGGASDGDEAVPHATDDGAAPAAAGPGDGTDDPGQDVPGQDDVPDGQPSTATADPVATVYEIDDPASVTVVVNKARPLDPVDYEPDDLVPVGGASVRMRAEAAEALATMRAAMQDAGVPVAVHSAGRTYAEQRTTFEGWVTELGAERAAVVSARPGYSEHQTGLAVDVVAVGETCAVISCFGSTDASAWISAEAHRFGYVVRYRAGHEAWTGYAAEPWHLRYVGVALATELHDAGHPSLEEHVGLEPAPDYLP